MCWQTSISVALPSCALRASITQGFRSSRAHLTPPSSMGGRCFSVPASLRSARPSDSVSPGMLEFQTQESVQPVEKSLSLKKAVGLQPYRLQTL